MLNVVPGFNLGLQDALRAHQAGRAAEAEAICRQLLGRNPRDAGALHLLGVLAAEGRRPDVAVELFRQAIVLRPDYVEAHYNLGVAFGQQDRLDEAAAAFGRAIASNGRFPEAYNNLGGVMLNLGRHEDAVAAYRQAIALRPDFFEAHSNLVYALYFHPGFDARAMAGENRAWNLRHAEPLRGMLRPHGNAREPERRLRIGYVSPDFRDHAAAHFLVPLLTQHDKRRVEVFAYSQVARPDGVTERLRACVDGWRQIVGVPDAAVAEMMRRDGIDILVDLTLHMARNRLLVFARKPAPIQVTWLGYPGSTGLTAIDYRLSDPFLDPAGMDETIYSEKTVRLPETFWCYDPLEGREVAVNSLPAKEKGVVTFGCLNNFCKINEGVVRLWAEVLGQVPGSRLVMLAPAGSARQRTVEQLAREGVAADRIEFVGHQPRRAYLETYQRIDIGLDTFPANGHTTSLDSLWMGVPVVTWVGRTALGRAGWCQLSNLGLTELAGQSEGEFVRIAVALAADLARLAELRSTLRGRLEQSPLMDGARFARNVEEAFRGMWRAWCAGAA